MEELPVLQEIERAAGECFRDIGMEEVADDEPLSVRSFCPTSGPVDAGSRWTEPTGSVAYLIVDLVDGNMHVEQVSVHPDSARRGVGRSLLDHAADRATAAGVTALTLTTFALVPWNAPYYQRCGFRSLDEAELTPGLRTIRAREARHGLDRWPRVCMRRDL